MILRFVSFVVLCLLPSAQRMPSRKIVGNFLKDQRGSPVSARIILVRSRSSNGARKRASRWELRALLTMDPLAGYVRMSVPA